MNKTTVNYFNLSVLILETMTGMEKTYTLTASLSLFL